MKNYISGASFIDVVLSNYAPQQRLRGKTLGKQKETAGLKQEVLGILKISETRDSLNSLLIIHRKL